MLLFLAGVIEQLDVALEHIGKLELHDARFGLMMTDNALELILHQIVKDKRSDAASWRFRDKPYPHEARLKKAFLGSFSDKVSFAQLDGGMSAEQARTFNIMHEYRNEVYHAGLAHHEILLPLAQFYFATTCDYIGTYQSNGLGWGSAQKMPERAQKYFKGDRTFPGRREDFPIACKTLGEACQHDVDELIDVLAADLDRIAGYMDTCLQISADGVYEGQKVSRDQAVLQTQAWDVLFEDEGKAFLRERKFKGSMLDAIELLQAEYPFRIRSDPIPSWQASAKKLRSGGNPHAALNHYQFFVKHTGRLRAAIEQSAAAAEAEIEAASDRMRGK
jgi:hypothetical protein